MLPECRRAVGDGHLDGILVHADVAAAGFATLAFVEQFGLPRRCLGRGGDAAAQHEQACVLAREFDVGQFAEVLAAVDGDLACAAFDRFGLLGDDAEAYAAVAEGGDEDGDALLVAGLHDGFVLGVLTVVGEVAPIASMNSREEYAPGWKALKTS